MKNKEDRAERALMDIARVVAEVVAAVPGVDVAAANSLGMEVAERVSEELGGQPIYFTKDLSILKRHREIYRDYFDGNYAELAAKYEYSEIYIRRVVSKMHKLDLASRQAGLFQKDAA